jgi:hypothetical protein
LSCLLLFLIITIILFYAIEFENIQSSYLENTGDILTVEDDKAFDTLIGKFIWEYRGLEMIIIAFILLGVYAGISAQIRRSNARK